MRIKPCSFKDRVPLDELDKEGSWRVREYPRALSKGLEESLSTFFKVFLPTLNPSSKENFYKSILSLALIVIPFIPHYWVFPRSEREGQA